MEMCDKCNTKVTRYYQAQWLCAAGHWARMPGHPLQYDALMALGEERDTLRIHKWRLVEVTEITTVVDSGDNDGRMNAGVLGGDG